MKLHPGNSFNVNYKKQVLAYQLIAVMDAKKKKFKTGLKVNYAAQTIVSELDENEHRSLDYLLSVNTLTSYLLLLVKKPSEALEFIKITERISIRLLEATKKTLQNESLEIIGEVTDPSPSKNREEGSFFITKGKPSQITGMLLSNYILAINLMLSIAKKFTCKTAEEFDSAH